MNANKQKLIRWKIYFDRARMYIGYIQFFMIGFVFFDSLKGTPFGDLIFNYIYISFPLMVFIVILLSLVIGKMDSVYGLREEEQRNYALSNPVLREIHTNMEAIKKELLDLRSKSTLEKYNNSPLPR